jgi:hypothetical protein
MILTRKLALGVAGVVAAGVLGTAGVAAATSETSSPAPAASSAPSTSAPAPADKGKDKKAKHARRAVIGRGMHGVFVVKGKDGPVTLVTIRGQVTAVTPTGVTVKAEDGFSQTFAANADTKVRGADAKTLADVKVGAKSAVVGVKSGNTTTARTVLVRK